MKLRFGIVALVIAIFSCIAWLYSTQSSKSRVGSSPIQVNSSPKPAKENPRNAGEKKLDDTDIKAAETLPTGKLDLAIELQSLQTADGEALLKYFQRGLLPSATPDEQYLAKVVWSHCNGHVNSQAITRETALSMKYQKATDAQLAILQDRIDVMAKRCAPLASLRASAWRGAGDRLSIALEAKDSLFARERLGSYNDKKADAEQLEIARKNIRVSLDIYGPVALDWKGASLLQLATIDGKRPGRFSLSDDPDISAAALMIAPCFAGQPCGPDSLNALGMCIGTGGRDCDESVIKSVLASFPENKQRQVQKLAQELASAVQTRNWEALGIE